MSDSINLTDATKESLLASESGECVIFLTTISHPDLTEPARICTAALERVEETDEDVIYGLYSRGEKYIYIPSVQITPPQDDDESPPAIGLSVGRMDEIVETLRTIGEDPPTVDVEMVLSTSPDLVDAAWPQFDLQEVEIGQEDITGTLGLDMLENEPGVPVSYTPATHPGLF